MRSTAATPIGALGARPSDAGSMTRRSPRRSGFTIIELLVVIAIMALLTAVAFALFSNARAKSRDSKREVDAKSLQDILALYVTNTRVYPITDASGVYLDGTDAVSIALVAAGAAPSIPRDPLNTGSYRYHYLSIDGTTYTITYYLETNTVPGKSAGQQQAGP